MSNLKPLNVELKKMNRARIYRKFLSGGAWTRQELAGEMNLCIPTVAKNIDEFLGGGIIAEVGTKGNTGGRNASAYSLVSDLKLALGIEITRTHVAFAMLDLSGTIIASERYAFKFSDTDEYYRKIGEMTEELINREGVDREKILGVGIGLPVLVEKNGRDIIYKKIIDFRADIHRRISAFLPYPVRLFNDANAAAYTEVCKNQGLENAFYIMLSNNIGGCFLVDHAVYTGKTQKAGEVGHMTLIPSGKKCYCGQDGCVETYLSATILSDRFDGNLQQFFEKLDEGDHQCIKVWNKYLDNLAMTINSVHSLLDCDIVLGGYVGGYLEPYVDDLKGRVEDINTFGDKADFLKVCTYKQQAIASGAALNFMEDYNNGI